MSANASKKKTKRTKLVSFSMSAEQHERLHKFVEKYGGAAADHFRWALDRHMAAPPVSPGSQPLDPTDGVVMPPRPPHPRDQE